MVIFLHFFGQNRNTTPDHLLYPFPFWFDFNFTKLFKIKNQIPKTKRKSKGNRCSYIGDTAYNKGKKITDNKKIVATKIKLAGIRTQLWLSV